MKENIIVESSESEKVESESKKAKTIGWHLFSAQPRYCANIKTKDNKSFSFLSRWWCGRLASNISFLQDKIESGAIASDSIVYILANGSTCDITLESGAVVSFSSSGKITSAKDKNNQDIESGAVGGIVKDIKLHHNIILVYDKESNIIYTNIHNQESASAKDCIDFLAQESGAQVESGCDFPFVKQERKSAKVNKSDTIESAIKKAVALGSESDFIL